MGYPAWAVKAFLIGKGMSPYDAEIFSRQSWVQNFDRSTAPKGVELNPETITRWKQDAKKTGTPFLEYAQQKLAPQTIPAAVTTPPPLPDRRPTLPQPVAPTPQIAGGAPTLPQDAAQLRSLAASVGSNFSTARAPITEAQTPFGMDLSRPALPTTETADMAGFAPITPQGGGGMYRQPYTLTDRDLSNETINKIYGESNRRDVSSIDAVINNMLNRVGAPGFARNDSIHGIATAPHQYTTPVKYTPPDMAQLIRDRLTAIASGSEPDPTGGSTFYRGGKYATSNPPPGPFSRVAAQEGKFVGGNVFTTRESPSRAPTPAGPYAATGSGESFADAFANPTMADAGMSVPDFTAANQPTYSPSPTPSSAQATAYPPPPAPPLGAPSMMAKPLEPMLSGGNMFGAPSGPAGTVPIGTSTYVPQNMSSINQPPMNMLPNPLPPLGSTPSPPLPTKSPAPTVPQPTIPGFGMAFDQSFGGPSMGPGGWPLGAMAAQQSAPSPVAPPLPTPSPARQGMFPMADIPLPTANPVRTGSYTPPTLGAPKLPEPRLAAAQGGTGFGAGPIVNTPIGQRAPGSSAIPGNMGIAPGTPPSAIFKIPSGTISPFRGGGMPASFAGVLQRNRLLNSSIAPYGMNVGFGGGF